MDNILISFVIIILYIVIIYIIYHFGIGSKERSSNSNNCCPDCKNNLKREKRILPPLLAFVAGLAIMFGLFQLFQESTEGLVFTQKEYIVGRLRCKQLRSCPSHLDDKQSQSVRSDFRERPVPTRTRNVAPSSPRTVTGAPASHLACAWRSRTPRPWPGAGPRPHSRRRRRGPPG